MAELPERARIVIIGGGVIGTSVAYHLATAGCRDVLLLEQGQLSCGTTWHAAGLVGQLRASESGTRLVQYSSELYSRLAGEVGLDTGFVRCGGVIVARTPERVKLRWTPPYLLTRGPYLITRNPMYVGELALWLGWALFYGSVAVIAGLLVLWVVVNWLVLPREERALEAHFGEPYRQYKIAVPRWFGRTQR